MADGSPARPPRLLRFALSLCVALGAIGVGRAAVEVGSWNEPLQEMPMRPLGERPKNVDEADFRALEEFNRQYPPALLAAMNRHRPALDALAVVNLVSSMALFAGALAARRRTPHGLSALRTGLGLSEAYAAISLFLNVTIVREIIASLSLPPGTSLGVFLAVVPVIAGLVLVAQLAFYVAMHIWLSRPSAIKALSTPV